MLDEKKIMERIYAMPIEELTEKFKQVLEDSHIPYTIEEGGRIEFCNIFPDETKTEQICSVPKCLEAL